MTLARDLAQVIVKLTECGLHRCLLYRPLPPVSLFNLVEEVFCGVLSVAQGGESRFITGPVTGTFLADLIS